MGASNSSEISNDESQSINTLQENVKAKTYSKRYEFLLDLINYVNRKTQQMDYIKQHNITSLDMQVVKMDEVKESKTFGKGEKREEQLRIIKDIKNILLERGYESVKFIAKGSYGFVFICQQKTTGMRFVIKAIKPFSNDPKSLQRANDDLNYEIDALKDFQNSPYISRYLGHEVDEDSQFTFIKLQECKGTLQDLINLKKPMNESTFIKIAYEIICGIQELHQKNYVIQDLKPDNILINMNDQATIGDLGFSKKLKDGRMDLSVVQGNFQFSAPEQIPVYNAILKEQLGNKQKSSQRSDIYSFGLILYYLLCKNKDDLSKRFLTKCEVDPKKLIKDFRFKDEIREIILKCTSFNPYERITMTELCKEIKKIYEKIFTIKFESLHLDKENSIKYGNEFEITELIQYDQSSVIPLINDISNPDYLTHLTNLLSIEEQKSEEESNTTEILTDDEQQSDQTSSQTIENQPQTEQINSLSELDR